jgi:hypothetical protein
MDCSICLCPIQDDDATSKTECGHIFHSKCIFTSIAHKNFSCPNCRKELTNAPNKESETDEIIRSIIEIHNIPSLINEEFSRENSVYFNSRVPQNTVQNEPFIPRNSSNNIIHRIINNDEQIAFLNRNIRTYEPRENLPSVRERLNFINDSTARSTRRFRSFLPTRIPQANTDINNINPDNNYSPNVMPRTIISTPSIYPTNILSLIVGNENTNTENMNYED